MPGIAGKARRRRLGPRRAPLRQLTNLSDPVRAIALSASDNSGEVGLLVVLFAVGVFVVVVLVVGLFGRAVTGPGRRARAALGCQLCRQALEVGPARAVLQLAGDLRLLGLGPAAPHGSTPSCAGQPGESLDITDKCCAGSRRHDEFNASYRPASQNPRSRPISAIRRSASRSAATAGGTPSSAARRKIRSVVS